MSYPFKMNDLVGLKINDWTILEARPNKRKGFVLAKCACGNIRQVRGRNIKSNHSKNCGCKKGAKTKGIKKIQGNSALHNVYRQYKKKAEIKNIGFELNLKEFQIITSTNCYYCNSPPSNCSKKRNDLYYYNGIDRVDNSLGYLKNNIVPCCIKCNTYKGSITLEMIYKILEFLNVKP